MLASDRNAARSIMVYSQAEDKIVVMDDHKLLAVGGDAADCVQEPDYFKKNLSLYALRNGVPLSTHAAANYMRGEKSYNLRRKMAVVDMLLAGFDADVGPSLCGLPVNGPHPWPNSARRCCWKCCSGLQHAPRPCPAGISSTTLHRCSR